MTSVVFLSLTYESPKEKSEIQRLEDDIEYLEDALEQRNREYEWLSEITELLIKGEIVEIPAVIHDNPPKI